MALTLVSGSTIEIGGVLNDKATPFVESDFDGQSWISIDGWQQAGAIGDTAEIVTSQLINRGRDIKQKGTANGGSMENIFAIIPDDPGQDALLAAADGSNKNNYAFRITWPTGEKRLFIALVTTSQEAGGTANTIQTLNVTLEINSNIVRVAAP
ncbi:phage tail tube protein [Oricola thermophila]|uniref:Phage tail protein n=1 Tax=Oricola thermophila TaxID=2742145 RepID=A0A6N1VA85_9HYPH|nr:hypothetical protein [Oricola thermophila]QKV17856.1 hypothetical protein HTY61_04975 [Oricola thermophila]